VLAQLLKQCLTRKPKDRPTFKEVAETLSRFVQVTRSDGLAEANQERKLTGCCCPDGSQCSQECGSDCECANAKCLWCKHPDSDSPGKSKRSMPEAEDHCSTCAGQEQFAHSKHNRHLSGDGSMPDAEEEPIDKADQQKPCHSLRQYGKGIKRTSDTL